MKAILVTPSGSVTIEELGEPLHQYTRPILGGLIEVVHPARLKPPFVMLVNETGIMQDLDLNTVGSWLYGTDQHGAPIVGNILIMKEAVVNKLGEHDIVGLSPEETKAAYTVMLDLAEQLQGAFSDVEEN